MTTINVLIVDDHPLMRQALQFALEAETDMCVIGWAANGRDALHLIAAQRPDVVILDLLMPQVDGLETLAHLADHEPKPKILVVSSVEEEAVILQALSAGADGYLTKTAEQSEIVAAARAVYGGDVYLPPQIATKVMRAIRQRGADPATPPPPKHEALTRREQAVLDLLGQGQSDQEIAAALHITPATVRVHLSHIMNKLGFEHRRQLVAYASRRG